MHGNTPVRSFNEALPHRHNLSVISENAVSDEHPDKTPYPMLTQAAYTPREVEPVLRISKNVVSALLNSGALRAVRIGRKWIIPRDALIEFLSQGSRQ